MKSTERRLTKSLGEEGDTLVSDGIVGPLPVEDFIEEALGLEGFDNHHYFQVCNIGDCLVLSQVWVFSDNDNSFFQEVLEDGSLFLFADKYHGCSLCLLSFFPSYDIQ